MNGLPSMVHSDGIRKYTQVRFGGYDHNLGAGDGTLWDMQNLTGDYAPLLASRPPRWTVRKLGKPNGLYSTDKLFWVDGTALYVDGVAVGTVSDCPKTFCGISGRVVVWPDKLIYTADGKLEKLEASYSRTGLVFGNGTYAGERAEANSVTTIGGAFPFKAGDAVAISGCAREPENNRTTIIREISEDGKTLRFYENTFTLPEGQTSVTETGTVTLKRAVPDLDFLCCSENRLWGCKGDTIWCCKLGDPYNWNVFDGLSTDAWSMESGTPGDFTGCASFLGYPVFFKEDQIFKVYGSKPSNFELMSSATLGVMAGSAGSLAIAGETLFYLARCGVAAYNGGVPRDISAPFGAEQYKNAVAGSDGRKYFVSMEDRAGKYHLFVYDTGRHLWHREDETRLLYAGYLGGLYGLTADGTLLLLGTPKTVPEGSSQEERLSSFAEFGDYSMESFDSKYPVRLRLRFEAEAGVSVAVQIQYNSSGTWETVQTVTAERKKSVYLPVPIQRCGHFKLRLAADGAWKLYQLEWEFYNGQYVRK